MLRRKKCRKEGTEDAIQPMPVSMLEQSMVCATQTIFEISLARHGELDGLTLQVCLAFEFIHIWNTNHGDD